MFEKLRSKSCTLSSNWYKKFRFPYLILVCDVLLIILFAIFMVKDYLVGRFDSMYFHDGLLILIILAILLIIRFNISLLLFSKQRLGLYVSILYLLFVLSVEMIYNNSFSPFLLVFLSVILFINKFLIVLPEAVNNFLVLFFYIISFYAPLAYYGILIFRKQKLKSTAKLFDVMTGFYASTLSKRLKIMDLVVFGFFIGISMMVGLISNNINWAFLCIILSVYSLSEFFKRLKFPNLTKKNKLLIYAITSILIFGIIYSQRLPYIGLIVFIFSIIFFYIVLVRVTKLYLKTLIMTIFSIIIIPLFCIGYNIFAYPEYGIVKKSIPFQDEKVLYYIVDKNGLYGVRNREYKIIRPNYLRLIYSEKNYLEALDRNSLWNQIYLPKIILMTEHQEGELVEMEKRKKRNISNKFHPK
ncbi:MAG: hypothetical protein WCQ30_08075 [Bacteroidales bacterium]